MSKSRPRPATQKKLKSNGSTRHTLENKGFPDGSDGKASVYDMRDQVRSLSWEDPLEKEMAIHSSTIAWKIPWTEEAGRLQSMGSHRVGHD